MHVDTHLILISNIELSPTFTVPGRLTHSKYSWTNGNITTSMNKTTSDIHVHVYHTARNFHWYKDTYMCIATTHEQVHIHNVHVHCTSSIIIPSSLMLVHTLKEQNHAPSKNTLLYSAHNRECYFPGSSTLNTTIPILLLSIISTPRV